MLLKRQWHKHSFVKADYLILRDGILRKYSFMKMQFLWFVLLFGCHSNSGTDIKASTLAIADSSKTLTLNNRDSVLKKSVKLFDNHLPFEILSFTNTLEKNTTDTGTSKCRSWTLSKKNILEIIKNAVPIGGTTWDFNFLVLTCTKSVKILQGGQQYDLDINAGSFFWVNNGDTTVLFGDYKKTDRKYFIEEPNND
jgi:hypothetical protein